MKPAKFDYYRAGSLEDACDLLKAHGDDAKILAGGQSLIAAMNFRLAKPKILVDIGNIENSNGVTDEENGVRISATTTQAFAEKDATVQRRLPVLADAINHIAHFQIRNKGTVGGSIVNADPASELPAMSLLLDADFEIRSASNQHTMPAEEFFITYMTTSLQPDEIVSSILFKAPPENSGWGFHEVARRAGDFALAGSAAVIAIDAAQKCSYSRVALFGVSSTPVRTTEVEDALLGESCTPELLQAAAQKVRDIIDPESDVHVTEDYRRDVSAVLTVRALTDAFDRAKAA